MFLNFCEVRLLQLTVSERERERERQRERDRERDRERQRQRETETERERQRDRETERETERQRERQRESEALFFWGLLILSHVFPEVHQVVQKIWRFSWSILTSQFFEFSEISLLQ